MKNRKQGEVSDKQPMRLRSVFHWQPISAHVLAKVSKHLALLACMMILAHASGRAFIESLGIFVLVVLAAVAHAAERALRRPRPVISPRG